MSLGPGAGGGANAAQVRNIALCSQLQEVHRSLVTLLPRLPAPATAALQTPLEALQATAIDTGGCIEIGCRTACCWRLPQGVGRSSINACRLMWCADVASIDVITEVLVSSTGLLSPALWFGLYYTVRAPL